VGSNGVLNAGVAKKVLYPITHHVVKDKSKRIVGAWTDILGNIGLTKLRVWFNADLYVFGRGAFSIFPRFRKYMACESCSRIYLAEAIQYAVDATERKFYVDCPACGERRPARAFDMFFKSPTGFIVKRWGPDEFSCRNHPFTGEPEYYGTMSTWAKNQIKLGRPWVINRTPQVMVDAVLRGMSVRLDPDRVFMRSEPMAVPPVDPTRSALPLGTIAVALKNIYRYAMLMKMEEVSIVTQMIPFRGVTPRMTGRPGSDVVLSGATSEWAEMVRTEYRRFMNDPAYLAVFPVPIDPVQPQIPINAMVPSEGAQAKLAEILASIRVPAGLILENTPYSGMTTTLKEFERDARANMDMHVELIDFVVKEVDHILNLGAPEDIGLRPLPAIDSAQKIGSYSGMAANGQVSRHTLHEDILGVSHEQEEARLDEEDKRLTERMANRQRRLALVQQELAPQPQAPVQQEAESPAPPEEGGPPAGEEAPPAQSGMPGMQDVVPLGSAPLGKGVDDLSGSYGGPAEIMALVPPSGVDPQAIFQVSERMKRLTPFDRSALIMQIAGVNPQFQQALLQSANPTPASDQLPLPEQRPPRRRGGLV
jgi:hypothetical protein